MKSRTKSVVASQGKRIGLAARMESFRNAGNGLLLLLSEQVNGRIHFAIALSVVTLGLLTGLNAIEWLMVTIAIALVIMAEAFNTALEYLADAAVPEYNELVGKAKDLAAFAVLVTAVVAVIIGLWAFLP